MTAVLTIMEGCTPVIEWPAIVRDYGPIVWKTAYRLLSHHDDAADCFQEDGVLVKEIAHKLGFTDQFHFTRVFKKFFGISPRSFKGLR